LVSGELLRQRSAGLVRERAHQQFKAPPSH